MRHLIFLGLVLFGVIIAIAHAATTMNFEPNARIGACVYNATPPTLVDGQLSLVQCDVNGKISLH